MKINPLGLGLLALLAAASGAEPPAAPPTEQPPAAKRAGKDYSPFPNPGAGYVTDLSQPDTLFRSGSFNVHILPILMVVFTILSQRIRGASQTVDPQQKMMSQIMPIFFLFIFYPFPSGLNLYWLFSTVFGFGVQLLVQRGDSKPQPQEVRATHERTRKR
jgi:membrane protein insertase Oxa1/YidC/SpoIIIJ